MDCAEEADEGDCCRDGDVRLVGGGAPFQGRVEYCRGNTWGTVCDDLWSDADASVVCKQLGYPSQSRTFPLLELLLIIIKFLSFVMHTDAKGMCCANFGRGFFGQPILLDNVGCSGTENSLQECSSSQIHNCLHSEDASVICQPPTGYPLMLSFMNNSSIYIYIYLFYFPLVFYKFKSSLSSTIAHRQGRHSIGGR